MLTTVEYICLSHIRVARFNKYLLDAVLYILDRDQSVMKLWLEFRGYLEGEEVNDLRVIILLLCFKCEPYRITDFREIKVVDLTVSF